MNEEEKKAWLEKLRIGKLNAKLNPKPKKPLTWRQAINEKCKDCIYDPLNEGGTWRQQITKCTSEKSCALWHLRPTSKIESNPSSTGEQACS